MLNFFKREKSFYVNLAALAVPMILANLVNSSAGIIDSVMISSMGEHALGAITIANSPFFFLLLLIFGVQSGGCVLVAQYHGKRDMRAISRIMGVSYYFCVSLTTIVTTIAFIFPEAVIRLWTNQTEMIPYAVEYTRIVSFSYILNCISVIYTGTHRAMGNTRLGMVVHSVAMVVNVILNYVLIFGKLGFPAMGVAGAAWATSISRVVELALVFAYGKFTTRLVIYWRELVRPGMTMVRDYIRYALPVVFNEALWGLAFSVYPGIFGRMSAAYVAAWTITGNVDRIMFAIIFGIGNAVSVIVGNDIGSGKDIKEVRADGMLLLVLCIGIGAVSAGVMALFVPTITGFFVLTDSAMYAARFMLYVNVAMFTLRANNFTVIVGLLRGGGDVITSCLLDLVPLYAMSLPLALLGAFVWKLPGEYVYLLICLDEFSKAIFAFLRVKSGKWVRNVTR